MLADNGLELPAKLPIKEEHTVGVDLGIKTFTYLSEGEPIESNKYLRNSLIRLKVLSRRASRKKKGSANSKNAWRKVSLLHERVTNQRKYFIHESVNKILSKADTIAIEDLNVSGMIKNHNLAKDIADASWAEFVRVLTYKADWQGKNVIKCDRWDASSKECSGCGAKNTALKLSDRVWACSECGADHERDHNAAINIKMMALRNTG